MSRPQMSIMTLYLVTIATHLLEFFSSHYGVNEELFRLEIDLKKKTNKQKRRTFSVEVRGEEGVGRLLIHAQSFQYARVKREFKIGRITI